MNQEELLRSENINSTRAVHRRDRTTQKLTLQRSAINRFEGRKDLNRFKFPLFMNKR